MLGRTKLMVSFASGRLKYKGAGGRFLSLFLIFIVSFLPKILRSQEFLMGSSRGGLNFKMPGEKYVLGRNEKILILPWGATLIT
jgi:hypothetical protein